MTDYTELKSRLRNGIDFDDSKEAADAIESLQRKIAELSKDAESWRAYKKRKDEVIAAGMAKKILRDAAAPKQEK